MIDFSKVVTAEQKSQQSLERLRLGFAVKIQDHVDEVAAQRGYANGFALAGYATSTVSAWASEAQTFIAWRDAVWVYAYAELARVQAGQRELPTIAELIAELAPINWPSNA